MITWRARWCAGTLLLQTATREWPSQQDTPLAAFHPVGIVSGPVEHRIHDPTVFWMPNAACARAMLQHAGFTGIETLSTDPQVSLVLRAETPARRPARKPDLITAPWS